MDVATLAVTASALFLLVHPMYLGPANARDFLPTLQMKAIRGRVTTEVISANILFHYNVRNETLSTRAS
jgi:hypothetical protein